MIAGSGADLMIDWMPSALTAGSNGALGPDDYRRMVDTLLSGGADPVIAWESEGIWPDAISDAALNGIAKGRGFTGLSRDACEGGPSVLIGRGNVIY